MHHVCKPKRMFTGLLAVVLAGFIVQSAAATRVLEDVSTAKTPLVIPYLSHGIGVDKSQYSGQSSPSTPLVIPYLSHGVGVEQSLYSGQSSSSTPLAATGLNHTTDAEQSFNSGTAQGPDAFGRAVTRHEVLVKALNAIAASSGPDAFQRAVNRHQASNGYYDVMRGIFATAHKATNVTTQSTAVRPDDRAGIRGITASDISSQPQSTAVRPDDRVGFRGIGTISAAQSTGSTSSTDWNTVFMAGGALLGVLLIIGAAVAFGRRQHGRVVAH
jgi:hypothetical protein